MKTIRIRYLAVAILLIPSVCFAQTTPSEGAATDVRAFLGKWTGQHEECTSGSSCESRGVDMTISNEGGQLRVEYVLSPSGAGFGRHTKSSSGLSSKSYPAGFERQNGVPTLSFITSSGTKVVFTLEGSKLIGKSSGGRFKVTYTLRRAGS